MFKNLEFLSDGVTIRATLNDGSFRIIDKHETELWNSVSAEAEKYKQSDGRGGKHDGYFV